MSGTQEREARKQKGRKGKTMRTGSGGQRASTKRQEPGDRKQEESGRNIDAGGKI